jgi:tetratricopeptide (TPR) repeat protein
LALSCLVDAIAAAMKIQEYDACRDDLGFVAEAAAKLGGQEGLTALQAFIVAARGIDYYRSKEALRAVEDSLEGIPFAAAKLGGEAGLTALQAFIAKAKKLEDSETRSIALRACAKAAQELKQRDLALKCLIEAVVAGKGIEDRSKRVCALLDIAHSTPRLGGQEGLTALQTVIADVMEMREAWGDRCHVLTTCAEVAQELKQWDLALKCLTDAAAVTKRIESAWGRCYDLRECAKVAQKLKQRDLAQKWLADAAAAAEEDKDEKDRSERNDIRLLRQIPPGR